MRILAVDIGTGTQDILLFDSKFDIENAYKLILPSPTLIVQKRLEQATQAGLAVLLEGVTMGGGPSQWAAEAHVRAGLPIYATPAAALSFNDDLDAVEEIGIRVVSEDEARKLWGTVVRIALRDFDFEAIRATFGRFNVDLNHLSAVAVGVFDHGAAPRGMSDRQFRFDYLDERIRKCNDLTAFAYRSDEIPPSMTRLQAVASMSEGVHAPMVVMDTAPAAILGATFDRKVGSLQQSIITNVGNLHTLAFRMGEQGIEGMFEHHTGMLTTQKLENLLVRLADGTLKHEDVFQDHGHGALIYTDQPMRLNPSLGNLVVTGPRRNMLYGSELQPYFAVPYGDMMISGCIGLLAAVGKCLPDLQEGIATALNIPNGVGRAPWETETL